MSQGEPFFSFKCDVDGRFALGKRWRGNISWQSTSVSSTVRLLVVGVPLAIVIGVAFGGVFWNVFGQGVPAVASHPVAVLMGVLAGYLFAYRLGMRFGDIVFPTKNSPVQSLVAASGMSIWSRRAGQVFSLVSVRGSNSEVEFRVSTKLADTVVDKLRATESRA
jgi:hypothetical protein